ncbi:GM22682 [Drosophila sechellia]|uniref:GM22682 n=1 Tax=Drosophila sechellia TaxID=7238 RepID=B4I657_DROSE|nr:GM22682 [Drosophila sechellia]
MLAHNNGQYPKDDEDDDGDDDDDGNGNGNGNDDRDGDGNGDGDVAFEKSKPPSTIRHSPFTIQQSPHPGVTSMLMKLVMGLGLG